MRGERIPTPVTRSLARNDRNRRRDTRVPPYRVRRFYGADRVVRPYGRDAAAIHMYTEKELPEGSSF